MTIVDGIEYVTTTEAVAYFTAVGGTVTAANVWDWKRRELITPVARDHGRPIYRLADVIEAEHRTRGSTRKRRSLTSTG